MMETKCFTGLTSATRRAQSGIESTGVKSPLISRKIRITKKATNIACCWVRVMVEIQSPSPSTTIRYTAAAR